MKTNTKEKIKELGPWFHNIHLPDGSQTAEGHALGDFPFFKWKDIENCIPGDLSGWTVLDIGCNAGFYSIELAKRGADVLGIDVDPLYLKQARWVSQQFGLENKIEFRQMQVYDISRLNRHFDLIWFMGVFYHLRYPMLALDIVTQSVEHMLVFQTLTMPGNTEWETPYNLDINNRDQMLKPGWPKMAFIENRLQNDPTNWWAPDHACIQAMLRSCGLKVKNRPGHEMYVCEKDAGAQATITTWNQSEYLSAIGQPWKKEVSRKVDHKNTSLSV